MFLNRRCLLNRFTSLVIPPGELAQLFWLGLCFADLFLPALTVAQLPNSPLLGPIQIKGHGVGRQHGHKEQDNHKGVDLNLRTGLQAKESGSWWSKRIKLAHDAVSVAWLLLACLLA